MNSEDGQGDMSGPAGHDATDPPEGSALVLAERQPGVEGLIALAIEHGSAVDALERLLAMRQTLKAEAAREAFFEALSAFQADCPVIEKGKTARIDSRTGASYTYKYAPLEDIMRLVVPVLRRHGLSVRFDAAFEATPPAQVVTCIVNHRDGHAERSEFRAPIDSGARMSVMQQSASALTYGRRYALLNALGIVVGGEDDDGHGSAGSGGNRAGEPRGAGGVRGDGARDPRVSPPTPVAESRGAGGSRVNPEAATSAGSGDRHAQSSRERAINPPPPAPRPLGRNVVRIARPSQEPQGSDGPPHPSSREPVPVAETPAVPESDANEEEKAELRTGLIRDWMTLLRATGKFDDMNNAELWDKATDVLSAQCEMQFKRPLHEMNLRALQDARRKTDETMAAKLGVTA
jgi:hypothetical protein